MSEPSLFPDETQDRLFQAARAAAADFIPLMVSILIGLTTPSLTAIRRAVRRQLIPAEAIARRLIWMLAGELVKTPPAPKSPRETAPAHPSSVPKPSARKPRTFRALRLTEPQPRGGSAPPRRPPVRTATSPTLRPPADPTALVDKLRLWMNGLLRAIAEPEAEARRLLRLRARAARPRTPPFEPGAPMVLDHPSVPRDFVLRLEAAAMAAWRRLTPNTS